MAVELAFETETDGVVVRVTPSFLEAESAPAQDRYVWAYKVEIENRTDQALKLVTRHWRITDCEGRVQEVNGEGVVGQTPDIAPGERFEYTSGAPLSAPSGVMHGSYRFTEPDGGVVEAEIPMFPLDSPYDLRTPN
ncbi:MAG: Co2+/Mg2+ efflux protein ApaG [Hyphomonadaceae bacterium]